MNLTRDAFGEYVNSREYQQFRKSQVESVPPSGHLDREKAKDLLNDIWADSRAMRFTIDEWVDRLAECVVPDPRLARIAALCDEGQRVADQRGRVTPYWVRAVRAVLGGGPA